MTKFLRPNKNSLQNPQHYEFMGSFLNVMNDAGLTAAKIVAGLGELRTAYGDEDRYYMIARASEIIAQRQAADRVRDDKYARLHSIVKSWAGSGDSVMDAPATLLKRPFDLYKVRTSAQLDVESGQLSNLINDLETTDMQAALATLHCQALYAMMKTAHEEVQSLRLEQGAEVSEKTKGALAAARRRCDQLYDQLTYLIEAFALTADNPEPYEAFIKRWNGTLKIYQDILDRKSGTPSSDGGGDVTPDGGGDDGGSDDGGSDDGGHLPPDDEGGEDIPSGGGGGGNVPPADEGGEG